MAQATATRISETTSTGGQTDAAESLLRTVDESTKQSTGVSLFHILTLGSIGALSFGQQAGGNFRRSLAADVPGFEGRDGKEKRSAVSFA